jgi:hypothetical protein
VGVEGMGRKKEKREKRKEKREERREKREKRNSFLLSPFSAFSPSIAS